MPDEIKPEVADDVVAAADDLKALNEGLPEDGETPEGPKINQEEPENLITERGAQSADPLPSPSEASKTPVAAPQEPEKALPEANVTPELKVAKSDEELEAELGEIEPRKGSHPGTVKAVSVLKTKVKEVNTNLREALTSLEAEKAKTKDLESRPLPKDIEEKLKNLEHFQRTFGIEHDQEFTEQYDKKIEAIETESLDFLKSLDLSQPIEKFIKDQGGIAQVRYSQKLIKDPQNPEQTITQEQWFAREILGNMDGLQQRKVQKMIDTELDLRDERDKKVGEAKKNAQSFIESRHKAFAEQRDAWFTEADKAKQEFLVALGPAAKEMEIKPDMSAEDKAQAEKHNAQVKYVNETFPKLLEDNSPRGRAATAMSALQARYLTEYVQEIVPRLQKELEEMTAKYEKTKEFSDKVKASGRTAKQSNAPIEKKKQETPSHLVTDYQAMKELDNL